MSISRKFQGVLVNRRLFVVTFLLFSLCGVGVLANVANNYRQQLKKFRSTISKNPMYAVDYYLKKEMDRIPSGEAVGMVLGSKEIQIEGYPHAYNASLAPYNNGYLMVFRYDVPIGVTSSDWSSGLPFHTYIGAVCLDAQFNQVESVKTLPTGSEFSEDPRIIKAENNYYVTWNDLVSNDSNFNQVRSIRMGKLNPEAATFEFVTNFNAQFQPIEKNWVPFTKDSQLFFVYNFVPHIILQVNDNQKGDLQPLPITNIAENLKEIPWQIKKWGPPQGGTPALLIGNEYFTIFHSKITTKGIAAYFMGAYAFEAKYPHRVTSMSKYPIFFEGAYKTPNRDEYPYNPNLRAVFPAGIVYEEKEGKKLLHVSIGENDAKIKIITLDYEKLKAQMKQIM